MAEWLVNTYGHPMEMEEEGRDKWMERNGMLYHFICDHFPPNTKPPRREQ